MKMKITKVITVIIAVVISLACVCSCSSKSSETEAIITTTTEDPVKTLKAKEKWIYDSVIASRRYFGYPKSITILEAHSKMLYVEFLKIRVVDELGVSQTVYASFGLCDNRDVANMYSQKYPEVLGEVQALSEKEWNSWSNDYNIDISKINTALECYFR